MRRAALVISGLLLAMFLFGPRAELDVDAPAAAARAVPSNPEALEAFVADGAAGLDVVPGTEARITWRRDDRGKTTWSVVYLHGFSATRQETAPLAVQVAGALDANLYEARFTGHGQSGAALAEASAEAWLRDAREAILIGERLGERVLVLASSTGATLATVAASTREASSVGALVFLSPNFGPRDGSAELLLWPWAERWVPIFTGAERSWEPVNERQARYWTHRYPVRALFPMMAAVAAARAARVESIQAPIRVFVHPADAVVDPAKTRAILERMVRSEPRVLTEVEGPGDDHVLAGDILSPARTGTIAKDIVDFVERL